MSDESDETGQSDQPPKSDQVHLTTPKSDQFTAQSDQSGTQSDQFDEGDCQILLNGEWVAAIYHRCLDKSVFSPITKKLETAHQVILPDGYGEGGRFQVTDSSLRRLKAEG